MSCNFSHNVLHVFDDDLCIASNLAAARSAVGSASGAAGEKKSARVNNISNCWNLKYSSNCYLYVKWSRDS